MTVVADSHTLVWYGHDSPRLSDTARDALDQAMATDGVIISIVALVELWLIQGRMQHLLRAGSLDSQP